MEKVFKDKGGEVEEYLGSTAAHRHVHFPVFLAIKSGDEISFCADFILDTTKGLIFIRAERPLKAGSKIMMRFFIPPAEKLLAEMEAEVVMVNPYFANCIQARFKGDREEIKRLEELLEEKRRLVDEVI